MYYHGTTDKFKMEDNIICPSTESGILREDFRKSLLDVVFSTKSYVSARMYANKASEYFGGNPIVYQVMPVGVIEDIHNGEIISDYAVIEKTLIFI